MKIQQLTIEQRRLTPADAELWVYVHVAAIGPTTQIRGNLSGPFCACVQTIQIAYPIKAIRPPGLADNVLVGRILIPEPNFWTLEMPFVYEGQVELWLEGQLAEKRPIRAVFKLLAG